jgi:hypothetical protein
VVGLVAAIVAVAGCSPKSIPAAAPPTVVLTPGNCSYFTHDQAVARFGNVITGDPPVDLNSAGGQLIDKCFYGDISSATLLIVGYFIYQYDNPATAQGKLQGAEDSVVNPAIRSDWTVSGLVPPATGIGPVRGGSAEGINGIKFGDGTMTVSLAVVGTTIGSYLIAAEGVTSTTADQAKAIAEPVFQGVLNAAG